MILFAKLCAFAAIIYLIKMSLYPFYRPVSNKQKKHTRRYLRERKKYQFYSNMNRIKQRIVEKYGTILISSGERVRLKKMIDRLDLGIKPEDIRVNQVLYTLAAVGLTVFMFKVNRLLGYTTSVFIILAWLYPVDELEKTIERKNKNISLDFPSFYSMVYYQYSKAVNIYLADVIKDYLPNANPDMADELGVMLDNIDYGESYALKQLKKRVPMHYIIKFCDIMETRLKGYNNVSQMAYLKNEIDEFRIRALEEELEKRQRTNSRLQLILIIILAIYIALYYLFTILASLRMFQ